jgi:hypothetical protein
VAARLERSLSRRGVGLVEREDIVQEVAARILAKRVPFSSADDLIGWALTTGHNLWTDDGRRWRRRGGNLLPLVDCDGEGETWAVTAPSADVDIASLVEGRLALDEVLDALRAMSVEDRDSIVAGVTGRRADGPTEAVRVKVRRHRVRQQLKPVLDRATTVLEGVAAAVGFGRRSMRSLADRLTGWRVSHPALEPLVVAMTMVAAPVLVGVLGLAAGTGAAPGRPAPSTVSASAVAPPTTLPAPGPAAVAENRKRGSLDDAPDSPTTRRPAALVESSVSAPTGHPIVDGRVSEEPGDETIVCVGNVPVVGAACISDLGKHP